MYPFDSKYHRYIFRIFLMWMVCAAVHTAAQTQTLGIQANGVQLSAGQTVNVCLNGTINWVATGQPSGNSWLFGGGTPATSNANTVTVTYNTLGPFITWQYVTQGSLKDSMMVNVVVSDVKPVADFTFSPGNTCSNVPVNFTNGSTGNGLTYVWNFGDPNSGANNTSTAVNPSHTFVGTNGNGSQTFNVTLTVVNSAGCSHAVTKTVTTTQIPDASINDFTDNTPFKNCNGTSFNLVVDNVSTTTATNTFYRINWGDGSPDFANAVMPATGTGHTYTAQGFYTLTLSVTGQNGCIAVKTYTIYNGANPQVPFTNPGNSIGLCVPYTFTIPSSSTSNPTGTIYIFTKNDGTGNDTLQNPPGNYTHVFTKTSCGATGALTPNAFFINVRADNPCGFSDLSVQPITTSAKPVAQYTTSPDTVACVGSTLTFTNTSVAGVTVDNFGTCDRTTQNNWVLTPATGWTLTSGSFGNANPTNNPSTWGSNSLGIRFTAVGTYQMMLIVRNACGNDTIRKNICIRNAPTASFTMSKKTGCVPDAITITNTSSAPECSGNTYTWSVTYADIANCAPAANPTFTFINGTSASSINPQIRFLRPGRYVVALVVNATGANSCISNTARDTFFLKGKPRVTPATLPSICVNNSTNPSAAIQNCYGTGPYTYLWSFANGTPATSTDSLPGAITYNTVNATNAVSLTVSGECGDTTVTANQAVTNKPTANAGPDRNICSGTTTTIGVNTGSFTYTWRPATNLSNANIAAPTFNGTYNGSNADTTFEYIIRVSSGASCVSEDTVLITVKKRPTVTLTPTSAALCAGQSVQIIATGADAYTWAPATGLTFNNTTIRDTVQSAPGSTTTYTVTGTTNGCPNTATVQVQVTAAAVANAGADKSICSGQVTTIGVNTGSFTYLWRPATGLNNPNIAVPTFNLTYNGANADTTYEYIVRASAGASCAAEDTVRVTVKKTPVVSVAPTSAQICSGQSVQLVATGATTYTWNPGSGLTFNNPAVRDTAQAAPAGNTTYTITGTTNGCPATATAQVQVTAVVNTNAGPDSVVCNASTAIQFTGTPAGGTWSGPSVTTSGIFNPSAAGLGTFKLYYTAGTGICAKTDSLEVTVISTPVANAGNDTTICQNSGNLQFTGTPGGGTWSGSPFVTAGGLFSPTTPGTYTLTYRFGSGSCSASDTKQVTVSAGVTNNTIAADQSICTGTQPMAINGSTPAGGNGTPLYQWQISANNTAWTDIAGITTKDYTPPVSTQTFWYRRIASTVLCGGAQSNTSNVVKITVNPNARAQFSATRNIGCAPFRVDTLITVTPYPLQNSIYNWYANGVLIGSGQTMPQYIVTTTNDSVTIRMIAVSQFGCKNDTVEMKFYTRENPVPAFSKSTALGCGPLTVSFTNNTPNAARYGFIWNFGNGQTSTLAQPAAITYQQNPLGGDTAYIITLRAFGGCDTITIRDTVKVRGRPRVLFTPDKTEGCSPMTVTFTNTTLRPVQQFVWDFGDGSPLSFTDSVLVKHTFIVGTKDTFYVTLKATNDCGTDSLTYAVVVNPGSIRLLVAINGTDAFGCAPHTVRFFNNSNGGNIYTWNFGDGNTLTTTRGLDTVAHTYTTPGVYTATLNATNSCTDTTTSITITVRPKPLVSFTALPNPVCPNDTVRFVNTSDTGLSLRWKFGDATTSTLTNPLKVYTTPGIYTAWLFGSRVFSQGNSCTDSISTQIVVRDTLPGNFTASDTVGACLPFIITFINQNRPSTQTTWDFGDGFTATGDSVRHSYTTMGTFIVRMISRQGGCVSVAQKTIRITPPVGNLLFNSGYVCLNTPVRFEAVSNVTSYRFIFGDGDSLVTNTAVVLHNYTRPGRFVPKLVLVTGNCEARLVATDTIKVDRIRAGFTTTQIQNCGNTSVNFTDTSNAFFGIRNWQWNFGDNTLSSAQNPTKAYTTPGLYFVRLQVTGISNCIDTITIPVTVAIRSLPASQAGGDTATCTNQTANFFAISNSVDSVANYAWNFGNNATGAGKNVSTVYASAGIYTIRLISRTVFGCADTVFKQVRVSPTPTVNAGNDLRICRGQSTQLNALGTGTWQWSPAQGLNNTTIANPVAGPLLTTQYVVRLTNAFNCSATDSIRIEVIQPFNMTVGGDDTLCIDKTTQLFASGATTYLWSPATWLSSPFSANPVVTPTNAGTVLYQVVGSDAYSCFTDTGYVRVVVGNYPTVDIGNGGLVVAGTPVQLNAVVTNGPVRTYNWTPATDLSCTNCGNPIATINNNIFYKVDVTNIYGCSASDTISFRVRCEEASQLYIPNAFSPDGDGVNDKFLIRGKGIGRIKYFRVFNRWGQLVFERNNINANDYSNAWDGMVNGKPGNPDVYVWMLEAVCTAGGDFVQKGNVTLVR